MPALFSSKVKKDLTLIVDVQSGVVRGALVSYEPHSKPHIIYVVTKPLPHQTDVNGTYLTTVMLKAVDKMAVLVASEGLERAQSAGYEHSVVRNVQFVLSSPWVVSKSKTIKLDYEKEVEITDALIKSIVDKERENLLSTFKQGKLGAEYEADLTFIEQKIFDIRLNGYSVADYKGKKVKNFEISFAVTTGSKYILEKLEETIAKSLESRRQFFHSALLLQYVALRSIVGNRDEYIYIHVHSELTDMVLVKRGISSYLASFPFGTAGLLRRISKQLKNSDETSMSLLSMHRDNRLEDSEEEKMSKTLEPILKEWQLQCLESLGFLGEKTLLPRIVYLSAHAHFELFRMALTETKFEVLPFDHSLVEKMIVFEKSSEKSTVLGMYALALNGVI